MDKFYAFVRDFYASQVKLGFSDDEARSDSASFLMSLISCSCTDEPDNRKLLEADLPAEVDKALDKQQET